MPCSDAAFSCLLLLQLPVPKRRRRCQLVGRRRARPAVLRVAWLRGRLIWSEIWIHGASFLTLYRSLRVLFIFGKPLDFSSFPSPNIGFPRVHHSCTTRQTQICHLSMWNDVDLFNYLYIVMMLIADLSQLWALFFSRIIASSHNWGSLSVHFVWTAAGWQLILYVCIGRLVCKSSFSSNCMDLCQIWNQ